MYYCMSMLYMCNERAVIIIILINTSVFVYTQHKPGGKAVQLPVHVRVHVHVPSSDSEMTGADNAEVEEQRYQVCVL